MIAAGVLVRVPQLGHDLIEAYAFRQTQTAMLARSYAVSGIDLRHSPLPVFGRGSDVPLEFPLVQAVAALVSRLGLGSDAAMRVVGLTGFVGVCVLLVVLVTRWHGPRVALISLLVLEFSPFGLHWGAASLMEFPAVAAALGLVLALDSWFRGSRLWVLGAAACCGVLAFVVKATTAPLWCLLVLGCGLAALARPGGRAHWRRVVGGSVVGVLPGLVAGAAWTAYADRIKEQQPLTRSLTSANLTRWNFGTLEQRTDPAVWTHILARVLGEVVGPLGLVLLVAGLASARRLPLPQRIVGLSWFAVAAAGPLLFVNLYFVHTYYLCAVLPAVCVAVGLGADALLRLAEARRPDLKAVAVALVGVAFASSLLTPIGRDDVNQFRHDVPPPAAAADIARLVPPQDEVVFVGCAWDPTLPYYARRSAAMLVSTMAARKFWATDPHDSWMFVCLGVDTRGYLPPGARTVPTDVDGLFRIADAG